MAEDSGHVFVHEKVSQYNQYLIKALEKIGKSSNNEREHKLMVILRKLSKQPMTLFILQSTGIGKTVNSYRKQEGEVGPMAKELVRKWKKILQNETHVISTETVGETSYEEKSGLAPYLDNSMHKPPKDAAVNLEIKKERKECEAIRKSNNKLISNGELKVKTEIKKESEGKPSHCLISHAEIKNEMPGKLNEFNSDNSYEYSIGKVKHEYNHTSSSKKRKHEKIVSQRTPSDKEITFEDALQGKKAQSKKSKKATSLSSAKEKNCAEFNVPQSSNFSLSLSAAEFENLGEISPNYIPLPQKDPFAVTRHEKIQDMISIKSKSKTQVYSGKKKSVSSKVIQSLFDSCIMVLVNHIDVLGEIGGIPYDILKPVFVRCTSEQLYRIEDMNSYLLGETDELWRIHCKRDFKNAEVAEFESWREIYLREQKARDDKLAKLTRSIKTSMSEAKPVRKAKLAYVEVSAKPPRSVRRQQIKNGTGVGNSSIDPLGKLTSHGGNTVKRPKVAVEVNGPPKTTATKPKVAPMMAKTLRFMKMIRKK